MSIPRSWLCTAFLGLAAAAFLPWAGHQLRSHSSGRCALDGAVIAPAMRVRILSGNRSSWEFCSLTCAEKWLQASGQQPDSILVTDETTGDELDAGRAIFVRSQVVTHGPTHERRHVFRVKQDAMSHADSHFGRILEGDSRPFSMWLNRQSQPVATQFSSPDTFSNRKLPKS